MDRRIKQLSTEELTAWAGKLAALEAQGAGTFGLYRQVSKEIERRMATASLRAER